MKKWELEFSDDVFLAQAPKAELGVVDSLHQAK